MPRSITKIFTLIVIGVLTLSTTGCTLIFQKGRRVDVEKISKLKSELTELERAKQQLEQRLQQEIGNKEVRVDMADRGLVITFVAEVLFDSGKAEVKQDSKSKLEKVTNVLNYTVREYSVGVEGHTDNVPIKHSGWKSNWELSTARALSVLDFMIKSGGVDPVRLSATGYGEYRPLMSNSSPEGRSKNRRVEIVILPKVEKEGR